MSGYAVIRRFQSGNLPSRRAFPDSRIRPHEALRDPDTGTPAVGVPAADAPRHPAVRGVGRRKGIAGRGALLALRRGVRAPIAERRPFGRGAVVLLPHGA